MYLFDYLIAMAMRLVHRSKNQSNLLIKYLSRPYIKYQTGA